MQYTHYFSTPCWYGLLPAESCLKRIVDWAFVLEEIEQARKHVDSFVPLRLFDPVAARPSSWLELCRQLVRCPICSNQFQGLLAKFLRVRWMALGHSFASYPKLTTVYFRRPTPAVIGLYLTIQVLQV